MTVLEELLFSLIYYPMVNKFFLERKREVMKHFLKGVATVAIVMSIVILIHVIFYMKGTDINQYIPSIVEVWLAASLATPIYQALIKNEKNKDNQK